ncbi:questin oxidase family protein [Aeromonas aquatica]|uniref:questin oxidase family protein n=1 Tax=Aeromonas aquatica TaxID=558964 RepID=UPI00286F127A|nr:questin oxidase family protein [Aeromonas aquatica]
MDFLSSLLDANAAFALNGRDTTNHCPMALHALHEMGATPAQLQHFFAHWQSTHSLPAGTENQGDEEEHRFVQLRQQLAIRFAEEGWLPTFETLLSQRLSPAGGAFHPLIRFACALENGHQGEQAAALAAWQCKPLILPAGTGAPCRDVTRLLARLSAQWEGSSWQGEWITARLRQVAADPRWPDSLPRSLEEGTEVLLQLAEAALPLYWQTRNFTLLHLVTGSRAAAIVARHLPAELQEPWQTLMWQAAAAAYITVGAPALGSQRWPDVSGLDWEKVLPLAIASLDDHVIKLVHCCWREQARSPRHGAHYLAVAARAVGLLNTDAGRSAA